MAHRKIGLWLVGAKGGVATTTITGLLALGKGLSSTQGLVSELPPFKQLKLAAWKDFVIGGHEIRDVSLVDESRRMQATIQILHIGIQKKAQAPVLQAPPM